MGTNGIQMCDIPTSPQGFGGQVEFKEFVPHHDSACEEEEVDVIDF